MISLLQRKTSGGLSGNSFERAHHPLALPSQEQFAKIHARRAYKPDSVQGLPPSMTIPLATLLPTQL